MSPKNNGKFPVAPQESPSLTPPHPTAKTGELGQGTLQTQAPNLGPPGLAILEAKAYFQPNNLVLANEQVSMVFRRQPEELNVLCGSHCD